MDWTLSAILHLKIKQKYLYQFESCAFNLTNKIEFGPVNRAFQKI